jgi:hypothetical protein
LKGGFELNREREEVLVSAVIRDDLDTDGQPLGEVYRSREDRLAGETKGQRERAGVRCGWLPVRPGPFP